MEPFPCFNANKRSSNSSHRKTANNIYNIYKYIYLIPQHFSIKFFFQNTILLQWGEVESNQVYVMPMPKSLIWYKNRYMFFNVFTYFIPGFMFYNKFPIRKVCISSSKNCHLFPKKFTFLQVSISSQSTGLPSNISYCLKKNKLPRLCKYSTNFNFPIKVPRSSSKMYWGQSHCNPMKLLLVA